MRPRQKSDEDILDIARKLFVSKGPHTSVEDISKVVGMSQPALFKRFGTKKNLLIQTLKHPSTLPWYKTARKGPDGRPFIEQLTDLSMEMHKWFVNFLPLTIAVKFSGIPREEFLKDQKEPIPVISKRIFAKWLQKCHAKGMIKEVNFNIAAANILGFIHSEVMVSAIAQPKSEAKAYNDIIKCIDFIWNGLKP